MDPVLFWVELGGLTRPVGSYGLMLALAVLVAGGGLWRAGARAGQDPGALIAAIAAGVGGGFVGAWSMFALVILLVTGSLAPLRGGGGGLVFYGAWPGVLLVGGLVARRLGLRPLIALDLGVPYLAAAHALGRLGCFLGGCCFGEPTSAPWGVAYRHPLAPAFAPELVRHPSPLYESAGLLVLALAFALAPPRRPGSGARLAAFAMGYALLRFFVERTRGDLVRGLWPSLGLSTGQLLSLLVLVLAALWWMARGGERGPGAPSSRGAP